MNIDSKIFVAGGTGMVGSAILRRLISSGYKRIVSNFCNRLPQTTLEPVVRFVHLDLTRQSDVETFFERETPACVFLAAAKVGGIIANSTYKAEFIYDNSMISLNIIHASYRSGVRKLLNLGSSCIYPRLAPQPMKEEYLLTGSLEPTNEPYAIAKIAALKMCRYYNEQYGTNFISVMPTNLYGPGDSYDLQNSHVLPALIRKLHGAKVVIRQTKQRAEGREQHSAVGTAVTLWGTGSARREFLYVDDLADAVVFLMERYGYADIGEIVNIGYGSDQTIKELAQLVAKIVGYIGDITWDASKPDGMPKKLLDSSKIRALGWKPKISLEEGIKRTYDDFLKNIK